MTELSCQLLLDCDPQKSQFIYLEIHFDTEIIIKTLQTEESLNENEEKSKWNKLNYVMSLNFILSHFLHCKAKYVNSLKVQWLSPSNV